MYSVYGSIGMDIYDISMYELYMSHEEVIPCSSLVDGFVNIRIILTLISGTGARVQLSDLGLEEKLVEAQRAGGAANLLMDRLW